MAGDNQWRWKWGQANKECPLIILKLGRSLISFGKKRHKWQETINDDANGGKAIKECPLIILKLGKSFISFAKYRALMAGDNQWQWKWRKNNKERMPPYHSEIKQKLNLILEYKGINGWRQSMTMKIRTSQQRMPPHHSEKCRNLISFCY